jgi:hypothetical protein
MSPLYQSLHPPGRRSRGKRKGYAAIVVVRLVILVVVVISTIKIDPDLPVASCKILLACLEHQMNAIVKPSNPTKCPIQRFF